MALGGNDFRRLPRPGDATQVLAVGDIHLENYGTWRDREGRLAWAVNDFDDAAEMPYVLDLVRLAASALLGRGARRITDAEICNAILRGYRQGLDTPRPVVLDREQPWLRKLVVASEKHRARFWKKSQPRGQRPLPRAIEERSRPPCRSPDFQSRPARRSAGAGGLGRPRWIGTADWRGELVVREAKALVTSAWSRAHGPGHGAIRVDELANGRFRSPDPWYRIKDGVVVHRLSPDNRKIEVEKDRSGLLTPDVLQMMGLELANVHLGTADRRHAIKRDLDRRKRGWLGANARRASHAITLEYKDWKAR